MLEITLKEVSKKKYVYIPRSINEDGVLQSENETDIKPELDRVCELLGRLFYRPGSAQGSSGKKNAYQRFSMQNSACGTRIFQTPPLPITRDAAFRNDIQETIYCLDYLFGGADAIGWEMLKKLGPCGKKLQKNGNVFIRDLDIIKMSNLFR